MADEGMAMLRLCDGQYDRRGFLRVGTAAMGGLGLGSVMGSKLEAAVERFKVMTGKSVVFLFQHGGPSQYETFDPKMGMPEGIRSVTGEVKTKLKGVTFGSTMGRLAKLADKFAVVRSFRTGSGNHDIKPIVCKETLGANMGSMYGRVAGAMNGKTHLPRNVALFPRSVDVERGVRQSGFGKFESTGGLGSAYSPFIVGGKGDLAKDMTLRLSKKRLDDRKALLKGLDGIRRQVDVKGEMGGLDKLQEQAFSTILGGAVEAFDLSKEDKRVVARYDTAGLVRPDQISRQWNNYNHYVDNAKTLGKLMLLARRLCERGAGFVTVTTNFVWDMHADQNNATMEEGMRYVGVPFDHAVSAFIEDVEARGLRDKILLVACGEMGRTPKINKKGGRDHWGRVSPLMLYGGGLKMGQVIGESSRDGGEPYGDAVEISNLLGTVMHTLFDVGELRLAEGIPVDLMRAMTESKPIAGLH